MEQTDSATRVGRLIAGALLPNLIGCIPLILIACLGGVNPFLIIVLGYMTIGVQSIIYSVLMEFFILPNIQAERSVILVSVLLCLTFPLPLLFSSPPPKFLSDGIGYVFLCLLGSFAIIKVSKILYCEYHKQYGQVQKNSYSLKSQGAKEFLSAHKAIFLFLALASACLYCSLFLPKG